MTHVITEAMTEAIKVAIIAVREAEIPANTTEFQKQVVQYQSSPQLTGKSTDKYREHCDFGI